MEWREVERREEYFIPFTSSFDVFLGRKDTHIFSFFSQYLFSTGSLCS